MRRDASERRQTLLDTATEMFRRHGHGVALEQIADRAGVGRGTLYRNFADRRALALAVIGREVEKIRALAGSLRDDPRDILTLLCACADVVRVYGELGRSVETEAPDDDPFADLIGQATDLMTPALDGAQKSGLLRTDINPQDLLTIAAMIAAPMSPSRSAVRRLTIEQALDLFLDGASPLTGSATRWWRRLCHPIRDFRRSNT